MKIFNMYEISIATFKRKKNICGTYAYTKVSRKANWDRCDKVELYE